MSARTLAIVISTNPAVQDEVECLLGRHRFTDRECDAVLILTEMYLEGFRDAGGEITAEITLKAGAKAVDTVWCLRSAKAREVAT